MTKHERLERLTHLVRKGSDVRSFHDSDDSDDSDMFDPATNQDLHNDDSKIQSQV